MSQTVEAVYEHGVFRPLQPVSLPERQTVRLNIEVPKASAEPEPNLRAVLEATGRVRELGTHLRQKIIPGVTLAAVREGLGRAGGKPLSEIIIEQRGPAR